MVGLKKEVLVEAALSLPGNVRRLHMHAIRLFGLRCFTYFVFLVLVQKYIGKAPSQTMISITFTKSWNHISLKLCLSDIFTMADLRWILGILLGITIVWNWKLKGPMLNSTTMYPYFYFFTKWVHDYSHVHKTICGEIRLSSWKYNEGK